MPVTVTGAADVLVTVTVKVTEAPAVTGPVAEDAMEAKGGGAPQVLVKRAVTGPGVEGFA